MNNMPLKLREQLSRNPWYSKCSRKNDECAGRITFEHCWIYAGNQIQEQWAIIPLCEYHHLGNGLVKWINQYISICRATDADLRKYPKINWHQLRNYLTEKYVQLESNSLH